MADKFDQGTRSKIMSSIRSERTKPELILKRALRGKGFSYQPKISGNPDFIHRGRKIAIFVHGCFWHGCQWHYKKPKSNSEYWVNKVNKNKKRDRKNISLLRKIGFSALTLWEHEILSDPSRCVRKTEKTRDDKKI